LTLNFSSLIIKKLKSENKIKTFNSLPISFSIRYKKKYHKYVKSWLRLKGRIRYNKKHRNRWFIRSIIPFLKIYHDYLNKRIKLKKRAFTFIDIKNKISLLFFYYYKINLLKTSKEFNYNRRHFKIFKRLKQKKFFRTLFLPST